MHRAKIVANFLKKHSLESIILLIASATLGLMSDAYFHAYKASTDALISLQQTAINKASLNHYIDHNDNDISKIYEMFSIINTKLSMINKNLGIIEGQQHILNNETNNLLTTDLQCRVPDEKNTRS